MDERFREGLLEKLEEMMDKHPCGGCAAVLHFARYELEGLARKAVITQLEAGSHLCGWQP